MPFSKALAKQFAHEIYKMPNLTMSLHTGDPSNDGHANEYDDVNYRRQPLVLKPEHDEPSVGSWALINAEEIQWKALKKALINHFAIWNKAGECIFQDCLGDMSVNAGAPFTPADPHNMLQNKITLPIEAFAFGVYYSMEPDSPCGRYMGVKP